MKDNKEVKDLTYTKDKKKVGLVQVLKLIESGLSPAKISKKYNIPKQNVSYFVGKLKKLGCIQKKGYGVWEYLRPIKEVKDLTIGLSDRRGKKSLTSRRKEIRGHAFIWRIRFLKPYDWKKVVKSYKKKKLTFQLIARGKVFRTIFENRKVWLNTSGLTIYEAIDFMGSSSFQVKSKAVYEMDQLIKNLLRELGLKFRPFIFTTSREHYGIIKHELARQYNEKKEKMRIRSEDGNIWMWIDDSKGLCELENNEVSVSRQVQNYWNSNRKHDFKVDADFILNGFDKTNKVAQKNAKQLESFADNQMTHVRLMKNIDKNLQKQTDFFKQFTEFIKQQGETKK